MARRRKLEETLEALRGVRQDPHAEASRYELRRVIADEGPHAVARAAAIVGEHGLDALAADLVAAFPRFFDRPERADPGCAAKTAIVEALRRLGQPATALYRRGAGHVQMEPVYGGRVDTAVDLRGASALALAEHGGADVLVDLAHLLADREPPVRISAARAVAVAGQAGGIPLLHLKATASDDEPLVVAECLLALLRLDAASQLPWVASLLDGPAPEAAASALGDSRLAEAFPVLRDWLPRAAARGLGRAATFALASLRRDEAIERLLAVVRDEAAPLARDAVLALASVRTDEAMRERVHAAAGERPELRPAVARAFDSDRDRAEAPRARPGDGTRARSADAAVRRTRPVESSAQQSEPDGAADQQTGERARQDVRQPVQPEHDPRGGDARRHREDRGREKREGESDHRADRKGVQRMARGKGEAVGLEPGERLHGEGRRLRELAGTGPSDTPLDEYEHGVGEGGGHGSPAEDLEPPVAGREEQSGGGEPDPAVAEAGRREHPDADPPRGTPAEKPPRETVVGGEDVGEDAHAASPRTTGAPGAPAVGTAESDQPHERARARNCRAPKLSSRT